MSTISKIITGMTKPDALSPIIALEGTVTGGRTIQAYKRGGEDEARERLIEESTGAIVWIGGVKCIDDYIGDPILKKLFGADFDVGTDKVLRTPFKNFLKKNKSIRFTANQIALIKAFKVLTSVLIADAFIGLVVPPLNQKLTKNLRAKKETNEQKDSNITNNTIKDNTNNKSANPAFKGSFVNSINVFTNAIENTNTGKLLSTDAGLISGRLYSARNNDERREIGIRDIGSIYFYMWAQNHVGNILNFIETGKVERLNPSTADSLNEYLNTFLSNNGGKMSVDEFKLKVLGNNSTEIPLLKDLKFEEGEISWFTKLLDKIKGTKTEPLKVIEVSELEKIKEIEPAIMDRIKRMSNIQPRREGKAVITKQQIIDAYNIAEINNPEFLDKIFNDFTGGKSKNEYKFVSNTKLYNLKSLMEDYVKNICNSAKDGKITTDTLKSVKRKNLAWNGFNFVAGFSVAAIFLSTLIPKFQYWVTKLKTGRDDFPGVYEEETKLNKSA